MKKIIISSLLSLALVTLSSDAMKRELSSSSESVEKKIRFVDPAEVKEEEFDQIAHQAMKKYDKKQDAFYPKRFYYVRGVPRKLANKYCWKMSELQHGFGNAYGDCNDYDEGNCHDDALGKAELFKSNMQTIRPFVARYTRTIIKKAFSLRSADLPCDEVGDECERAISDIYSDTHSLSYILRGKKFYDVTKEQLNVKWEQVLQKSLEHQLEIIAASCLCNKK